MKTPILGASYVARSVNAADNRMVNLFPEAVPEGGKEAGFLSRAPGLRLLATVGTGPIRGLWYHNNFLYVVSGAQFYKVTSAYASSLLGVVAGTGPVSMIDNGTQIFIAAGTDGSYIYNTVTNAFGAISDPDFPGATQVGYLDQYFVFIEPNSQNVWVTSILDGTSIDPLDFEETAGSPDNLVGMIVDHREVWLFGQNSVEVWYNAGGADFPLSRIQGAFNEIGCAATFSIAKMDNSLFWLGADARGQGVVYRANGYSGQRISTHAVEWQIQQYSTISDAIGYTYQQDGHSFYVLTFPTADKTWVLDLTTNSWHERAGYNSTTGMFTRHRSNCQAAFNNEIVVGDYANGNLYAFDLEVYDDDSQTQRWLRSWRAISPGDNDLKRTAHHSLQLDCETGVGTAIDRVAISLLTETELDLLAESGAPLLSVDTSATASADPQVMLRWSDDGGHTWSSEHWRSMGKIGQYGYRTIWRRLGMTTKLRDRVYEVSGTDPVKVIIIGAHIDASPTNA
jgi:hypothetical protein